MTTEITMTVTDVQRKISLLSSGMRGLGLAVKGWLQETIQRAFERESTPEGQKWPALSTAYAARKGAMHGRIFARRVGKDGKPGAGEFLNRKNILYLSGDLLRGFSGAQASGIVLQADANGATVTAFSALPYAGVHQFGGRAGRGLKALIPKRSYLPTPQFAEKEVGRVIDEVLQAEIGKAGLA